jgi:hypothetical protein
MYVLGDGMMVKKKVIVKRVDSDYTFLDTGVEAINKCGKF